MTGAPPRLLAVTGVTLALLARLVAHAADAPPDALESTASVPVDTESTLVVRATGASVEIAGREGREVRFVSRESDGRTGERKLGVWLQEGKIVLGLPPGESPRGGVVRIEVPPGFNVKVDAEAPLSLRALQGSVEVHAKDAKVIAGEMAGTLDLEVEGGSVSIDGAADVTLKAKGTQSTISASTGNVSAHVTGGAVTIDSAHGATDLETDEAAVKVTGAAAPFQMKVRHGSAWVKGLTRGGNLTLAGAELKLESCQGDIEVSSDASVTFMEMEAAMHVDMYGGILRGRGNQGLLEVRTRNTEVNVESIDGPLRIQGEGLKAKIIDVAGDLYVETSVSEFVLDKAQGAVELNLDRGNATIKRTQGLVTANVKGGDIHLIDIAGPVALDVDRGNVEASWVSVSGSKDSTITTSNGDVTLKFAQQVSCRVEAKSKVGRVESSIESVRLLDDGAAAGPVGHGTRPVIKVEANGEVKILDANAAESEDE